MVSAQLTFAGQDQETRMAVDYSSDQDPRLRRYRARPAWASAVCMAAVVSCRSRELLAAGSMPRAAPAPKQEEAEFLRPDRPLQLLEGKEGYQHKEHDDSNHRDAAQFPSCDAG